MINLHIVKLLISGNITLDDDTIVLINKKIREIVVTTEMTDSEKFDLLSKIKHPTFQSKVEVFKSIFKPRIKSLLINSFQWV